MNMDATMVEEADFPLLLVDDESGDRISSDGAVYKPDEIKVGNILTIRDGKNKQHFVIKRIDEDETGCVYISPAKSNLLQVLLLLGCLTITWFVIDYFVSG